MNLNNQSFQVVVYNKKEVLRMSRQFLKANYLSFF